MRLLVLLFTLLVTSTSLKFLVFSTQFAKSHVNFLARLSDVLVDAGHEVVMVSPVMNSQVGEPMTKKARVIQIPQNQKVLPYEKFANEELSQNVWVSRSPLMFLVRMQAQALPTIFMTGVIAHPELIDQLKNEKFDAAFSESFDLCGPVIFHLIGVEKWAVTDSVAIKDGSFYFTQTPTNPAYVPSLMAGSTESMSFFGRLSNFFGATLSDIVSDVIFTKVEEILRKRVPDLPGIKELMATNSLVFFNSEPLVDFPKITSARTIDIGGITVSSGHKPLNETWSNILDLRPRTILLSFGTMAKAFNMPEEYKRTILETFKKFHDVTFIWKYEKPEHNISAGVPNLIESLWVPQRDMLHDPRLSAFITHCGQGSTTESIDAGIPLIVIPVMADQLRNAHQIERNGNGIRMAKTDLVNTGKLENAIREILENDKYRQKARSLKQMIADRPFSMKEIFVKNMEFLAKHGPLRQLDHYGRHLNFFQYYLID
ncbi:hypothetical protein PFISCL1PPCAC_13619, partial [Pristionchus fissidentatus]